MLYSYSPEEELEDPYYLCIRLAIEKKLKDKGYARYRVKQRTQRNLWPEWMELSVREPSVLLW